MKSRLGLKAELPVADIVKEALELLWQKRADVIRMFLPAIVILAAVDWASQYFFPQNPDAEVAVFHPEQLLFMLASLILSVLLATACHRFTLLPKEQWNASAIHAFGRQEFRYLLRAIQIGVICAVVFFAVLMLVMTLVGEERAMVAAAAAVMLMLYVWSRLSITLPEVALGQITPLSRSWKLSQGNGSRLVVVVWLVPVVMALPFWLAFLVEDRFGITSYLAAFGIYLTTLVSLVMLSLSYRFLLDFSELEEPSALQAAEVRQPAQQSQAAQQPPHSNGDEHDDSDTNRATKPTDRSSDRDDSSSRDDASSRGSFDA